MRSTIAAALIILSLAPLAACRARDPVKQRLDAITSAVEDRDADDVVKSLSDNFQGNNGESRQEALDELRRYLFAYQNINVRLVNLEIARREFSAAADFVAEVIGNPKTIGGLDQILPRTAKVQFHIEMRREGHSWLVTSATWQRVE